MIAFRQLPLTPNSFVSEAVAFKEEFQKEVSLIERRLLELKRKVNSFVTERPEEGTRQLLFYEVVSTDWKLKSRLTQIVDLPTLAEQPVENITKDDLIEDGLIELSTLITRHNQLSVASGRGFYTSYSLESRNITRLRRQSHDDLDKLNQLLMSVHEGPSELPLCSDILKGVFGIDQHGMPNEGSMSVFRLYYDGNNRHRIHDPTLAYLIKAQMKALFESKDVAEQIEAIIEKHLNHTFPLSLSFVWGDHRVTYDHLSFYSLKMLICSWTRRTCSLLLTIPKEHETYLLNPYIRTVGQNVGEFKIPLLDNIIACTTEECMQNVSEQWLHIIVPALIEKCSRGISPKDPWYINLDQVLTRLDIVFKRQFVLTFDIIIGTLIAIIKKHAQHHPNAAKFKHLENHVRQDPWVTSQLYHMLKEYPSRLSEKHLKTASTTCFITEKEALDSETSAVKHQQTRLFKITGRKE